jgi:hypothetical protein
MTTEKPPKKRAPATGMPIKRPIPLPEKEDIETEVELSQFEERLSRQAEKDQEKLEQFQEQFGGDDYYVRVEKYNAVDNEFEIVDKIAFDNFDPYILGKKYGGGRFTVTLMNSKSKYVEGGRFHFNFAKVAVEEKPAVIAAPDPMSNPMVVMILENMRSDKAALMDLMKTLASGEKQSPVGEIIAAVKNINDMNPRPKEENSIKNLKDLMELQAIIAEASGGKETGGGVVSEIMEALKVLKTSGTLTPAAPPQTPVRRMIQSGGTPIVTGAHAPPRGSDLGAVTNPEVKPAVNEDPIMKKLSPHIPQFIEAAAENAPAEKWASYLIEILDIQIVPLLKKQYAIFKLSDDDIWEKLIAAGENQDVVNKIFDVVPDLAPYTEWVNAVIVDAIKQFDAEGSDVLDPDPVEVTTVNGVEQ